MAKRERKPLTQRERQCQKVAREKALRKIVHSCWHRVRFALAALAVFAVVSLSAWEYFASGISRTAERTVAGIWQMTADAGFTVQTMYLEGRSRSKLADVQRALGVKKGQPILALPLDDIRARLEALPAVKYASVERALPGTLYVRLVERDPVAVWQHNGKLSLIDDEGAVMEDLRLADWRGLPLVIGNGAPKHVTDALALVASQPDLAPYITAITRVGDRRWNVVLSGGVEVKLPEQNMLEAWARLAEMHREQKILERAIRAVDMREAGRTVIRLSPGALPSANPVSARET